MVVVAQERMKKILEFFYWCDLQRNSLNCFWLLQCTKEQRRLTKEPILHCWNWRTLTSHKWWNLCSKLDLIVASDAAKRNEGSFLFGGFFVYSMRNFQSKVLKCNNFGIHWGFIPCSPYFLLWVLLCWRWLWFDLMSL